MCVPFDSFALKPSSDVRGSNNRYDCFPLQFPHCDKMNKNVFSDAKVGGNAKYEVDELCDCDKITKNCF